MAAWVRCDVVLEAQPLDLARLGLDGHGAGARIAVTWLAHAARVEDAAALVERERLPSPASRASTWPRSSRKVSWWWVWPTMQ